jgi:hypothetical protein
VWILGHVRKNKAKLTKREGSHYYVVIASIIYYEIFKLGYKALFINYL